MKATFTASLRLLLPLTALWLAAAFVHGVMSMNVERDAHTAVGVIVLIFIAAASQAGLATAPFVRARSVALRTIVLIAMLPGFGILIASLVDIAPDLAERPASVGAWFSTALVGSIAYLVGAIGVLKPSAETGAPNPAA